MGHIIDIYGMWSSESMVDTIFQLSAPYNVEQLQSVLGMAGYLRQFVTIY